MITILQQPGLDSLQSAGNDVFLTVSANTMSAATITDYKYVADVYVNTDLVATLKAFPDPEFNIGVFNLNNIPSSFISSYIDLEYQYTDALTTLFGEVPNGYGDVLLSFGEQFLSNGSFVRRDNLIQSNNMVYINAALPFLDSTKLAGYSVSPGAGNYLAAKSPIFNTKDNFTWPELRQYMYFFLNEDNSYNLQTDITTYNSAGSMVGIYRTTAYTFPSGNRGLKYIACGPTQLANLSASTYAVISGSSQIINPSVASYTIQLRNFSPGTQLPAVNHFYIKQNCSRDKRWNVYWLDEAGNYSSWRFQKQSIEKATKTQSEFKKIYGTLEGSGQYTVKSYDRNTKNFYTSIDTNISMTTDFLTDNQVLHLKSLFKSQDIYIEDLDGSGKIIGVTITDTDYVLSKRVNTKLYTLKVNFKLAYNDYSQLG